MKKLFFSLLVIFVCAYPLSLDATVPPQPSANYKAASVLSNNGDLLIAEHAKTRLPLASLTKLMTAIVLCDMGIHWNSVLTYMKSDDRTGGRLIARPGERFFVKDAFNTMLVGSANNATITLVRSSGISQQEFVKKMNAKARLLKLSSMSFVEPTGLDSRNVATVVDIARLAKIAFSYPDIRAASSKLAYTFVTQNTKKKHTIKNTNTLLSAGHGITAGKTGFINEVGYNVVVEQKMKGKPTYIAVLLGGKTSSIRFSAVVTFLQRARQKMPRS